MKISRQLGCTQRCVTNVKDQCLRRRRAMRLHKKLGILTISYVFAGYLISGSVPIVNAQTTNITGSRLGTNPVRSGNTINIGGGERAGANLLHSFGQFDLAPGDIANFSPREGANTVISRVTGAAASNIG